MRRRQVGTATTAGHECGRTGLTGRNVTRVVVPVAGTDQAYGVRTRAESPGDESLGGRRVACADPVRLRCAHDDAVALTKLRGRLDEVRELRCVDVGVELDVGAPQPPAVRESCREVAARLD